MWDDRFLFVVSALSAIGLWIALGLYRKARGSRGYEKLAFAVAILVVIALLLGVGTHIWRYREKPALLNAGGALWVLLGAVFGSFTAKFVWSMFGSRFGRRDPIVGACVLVLLAIAYTLPLYQRAITTALGSLGLSSIKTPIAEFTFNEASNRGQGKSLNASREQGSEATQSVPRISDPSPGLTWLQTDISDDDDGTMASDLDYIQFLEPQKLNYAKSLITETKQYLLPTRALGACLRAYVRIVRDSQLLLIDIKPVLDSLLMLHARAKIDLEPDMNSETGRTRAVLYSYPAGRPTHLEFEVGEVLKQVNKNLREGVGTDPNTVYEQLISLEKACSVPTDNTSAPLKSIVNVHYLQPYTTLVLSDLLLTHGAGDEAISVLAEWLTRWAKAKEPGSDSQPLPDWFMFRISSRLVINMYNVAGEGNVAYRDFFTHYVTKFAKYVETSKNSLRLEDLPLRCKAHMEHEIAARDEANEKAMTVERKVYYLLLSNESELLRTEASFLYEQNGFEALEKIYRRANFVASVNAGCLPQNFLPSLRSGLVAEHKIYAGLVGLAVSDRMATIARSAGDRDRAVEIRRLAEDQVHYGLGDLAGLLNQDRDEIKSLDWPNRIFSESRWERPAMLARRALQRLRGTED
jgi:hypothetical protein